MLNNQYLSKKLTLGIFTCALTMASGLGHADDTEIYFSAGASGGTSVDPNVIFILDSSGSMTNTATGTGKSRIAVLKEAMNTIINDVEDVNLGLMRFTREEGGPVLFPVAGIDDAAATVESEPDDLNPTYEYVLSEGDNDGEEESSTNAVSLTGTSLVVGEIPATAGASSIDVRVNARFDSVHEQNNKVKANEELELFDNNGNTGDDMLGLRFNGINIPQGATITAATLTLTTESEEGSDTDFKINGHDVDNSSSFVQNTPDVTTRYASNRTSAQTVVNNHDDDDLDEELNEAENTFDVRTIVAEIVGRGGWVSGNSMSFLLHSNDDRRRDWHSFFSTSNTNKRPRLQVTYAGTPTPAEPTEVGIHFPLVNVPQGATVTSAKLILTSKTTQSGAATWNIDVEEVDDSAPLSNTANDIGGRSLTGTPVTISTLDVTDPIPDPFNQDDVYSTSDLSSVVQTVVSRPGWCGGNAMTFVITGTGTRYLTSFDNSSDEAPKLEVTYDGSGALGCSLGIETAQVGLGTDDTEGSGTGGNTLNLEPGNNIGIRFDDIDVPKNAVIRDARIVLTARDNDTGSSTIAISAELVPDATTFGNIDSRTPLTSAVNWSPPNFVDETKYTTDDISSVVQALVNQGTWASGNAMVFKLVTTGNDREAYSYNSSTTKAPRLSITYEGGGTTTVPFKTVRERLIELVNELPTSDWTPITEVLYEAAHYWRGEDVVYGLDREGSSKTRISHPGSYCDGPNDCNGANTATYPDYGVFEPSGCSISNLDDSDCSSREIKGSPTYISPFNSELSCAKNYQILLTDGEANRNNIAGIIPTEYLAGTSNTTCRTTKSDGTSVTSGEKCAIDLAEFLFENDQDTSLDNDQTVVTYTVGFDTASLPNATQFLKDVAAEGGGEFFEGTSAADLVSVFESILTDVKSDPTSIVSPSLATNAFNRLFSRDEVYFGLFTPELTSAWDGNVKKYNVCTQIGTPANCDFITRILDANDEQAVDANDRFKTSSQSEWSDVIDGIETVAGGVGGELTDFTDRVIYTETTSTGVQPSKGTILSGPKYQITSATWNSTDLADVRNLVCPTPSTTGGSDCEDRMLFMLGKVIVEKDSDVDADTRWTVNDVLHSSPVTITYGGSDSDADGIIDTFFDKLIFGTNDGGLRMINADTGKEDWMFLPQSKMDQQQTLFTDPEGEHSYGIDQTPVVNINDVDNDGFIEPVDGDTVHAYFGMRRGGRFIYALDLTANVTSSASPVVPDFLWRIEGGVTGSDYQYLADTWSQPELSTILTTTGPKEVLIFGGGYDTALDSGFGTAATGGSDNDGNMIFIVDPADGSLIFSIGGSSTNATLKIPEMTNSIAAAPTVLDTTGDGNDNRIYIADTGGQVFRVDLASDINPGTTGTAKAGSTVIGRLAAISTVGTPADERRFFEKNEVAAVLDTAFTESGNSKYFLVTIGSGNRANPLSTTEHDRFYGFRDYTIDFMTGGSGVGDAHIAQDYPQASSVPIDESVMIDISLAVLDENSTAVDESFGWYLDFTTEGHTGEKVFSSPLIIGGNVFITTYEPEAGSGVDLCSANLGGGRLIGFNVTSTVGFTSEDVDGRTISDDLRGIASAVIPFYAPGGIYGLIGVEGGVWQPDDPDEACKAGENCTEGGLKLGENAGVLTYWSEE